MASTPSDSVAGSCLCETVRFSVRMPTLFCMHCHCSMCRRNHGAGFVTWCGVKTDQLEMIAGESELVRYASSPHGSRSFCGRCGSSLFCVLQEHPDTVDIPIANLDGPIDRKPEAHIYFDSRADWVEIADELPRLGGETGLEPVKPDDA